MSRTLTDREALLRAILDNPDEDVPRLMLADWLDENPTGPECSRPQWAKMIRGQVDPAGPLRFHTTLPRVADLAGLLGANIEYEGYLTFTPVKKHSGAVVRVVRGFVHEVELTAELFCGGPCWRCGETGTVHRCNVCGCEWRAIPPDDALIDGGWSLADGNQRARLCCDNVVMDASPRQCHLCRGSRRTPGAAADIFRNHPVRSIKLADKRPVIEERIKTGVEVVAQDFRFWRQRWVSRGGEFWEIPARVYDLMPHAKARFVREGYLSFDTKQAAHDTLNAGCVAFGRTIAVPETPASRGSGS